MNISVSILITYILQILLIVFCSIAAVKDAKTRKIPNWIPLTLFCIWVLSVVAKWILGNLYIIDISVFEILIDATKQIIASALICCIIVLAIILNNRWRKKNGKPKASSFGMGDIKLLMVVCLFLGIDGSLICLIGACFSFILYILIVRLATKKTIKVAPFAPFILAGILIATVIPFIV